MELKSGYKQTEVGVIPTDWNLTYLGDLINDSRGIRYGIVQPGKFDPSGRHMIRGQDYSKGWVNPSEIFRVSAKVEEPFKNARVKEGDVIITIVGASTGHISVIPDWLDGANLTQTTARLAIEPSRAISGFCKYYLQSAAGQGQVANYLKGAAQPGLNCGDIEKFRIPLPPTLREQEAIAEALEEVDQLLEGLDRLIAKKRDIKQAAMQQLLTGQTRLPGFEGEWQVKRLGDIAEIVMGQSPSSLYYNTQGYGLPLIQGNADISDRKTIVRIFTSQITKRGKTGDILLSVRAPVGEVSIATFDVCLGRGVCAVRYPNGFLYYGLIYLEPTWAKHSKGSTFDSVNSIDIKAMEISIPLDPNEQKAIVNVLSDMDQELATLEQRREKTRTLKQGMMQQLLTGKVRLV